jgi:hypothetical protein
VSTQLPQDFGVSPPARNAPSPDELAAIVAAVELAWPRAVLAESPVEEPGLWRFSGRWWSRPHAVHRHRPWVSRS